MIVPHKKVIEQIAACHPVKQSQPTMYDKKRWQLGGDHSETQWYWPPDVGALQKSMSAIHFSLGPNRANLHRSHLSNREIHEGEANKHNEERPDHTGGSAIGHDGCEGCEKDFPCCNERARESDHRSELEIPLLRYVRMN